MYDQNLISEEPLILRERIKLAHLKSNDFSQPMKSLIKLAYWSIFLAKYYENSKEEK